MKFTKQQVKEMADSIGVDWNKYDFNELYPGVEVELEHGTKGNWDVTGDDLAKTMKIALAHLDELPDYYTRLEEMEEEGKKALKEDFSMDILNELIEEGYDVNDLDNLYEFCIDYILEYEDLLEEDDEQKKKASKIGAAVGAVGAGGTIGATVATAPHAYKTAKNFTNKIEKFDRIVKKNNSMIDKIPMVLMRGSKAEALNNRVKRNTERIKRHRENLNNSVKKDFYNKKLAKKAGTGAAIGAGLTAAGIGGKAIYDKLKNKKDE